MKRRLSSFVIPCVLACVSAGLSVAAAACSESERSFDPQSGTALNDGGGGFGSNDGAPAPNEECQKMDILFVIDDSNSMKEEQGNLAQNFPKFVDTMNTFKTKSGAKIDWRVAVTTTGRDAHITAATPIGPIPVDQKGDNGAFRDPLGCGGEPRKWIEDDDANALGTFACVAQVGDQGPGYEMPLECMKLALVDRVADGTNAGFLRNDALTAVIILTDEEDGSRHDDGFTINLDGTSSDPGYTPVAEYVATLDSSVGVGKWATAVIAGPTNCKSAFGDAAEAKRLKEFVALAGPNGSFSSICSGDLTTAIQNALGTFDGACKKFGAPK